MLVPLLSVLVKAQSWKFSIENQFPIVAIPSFGFDAGGTFNVSIASPDALYSRFIMLRDSDTGFPATLTMRDVQNICAQSPAGESRIMLNFSGSQAHTVYGIIPKDGVYSSFIVNCRANQSIATIEAHFRNPRGLLDTRDMAIERVYRVLGWLYLSMFIGWIVNGWWFSAFRVPLHTMFTVMPAIRFVESLLVAEIWRARNLSDDVTGKEVQLLVFDLLYYVSYLCAMAFVGSGWCIFRQTIATRAVVEIVLSSVATTLGVIFIRRVSCILGFVVCLLLGGVGIIAYSKFIFVLLIILSRLLDELKETQLSMKIRLAREYLVKNFVTTIVAAVSAGILISVQARAVMVMIVFEAIFVIGSLQQMKSFMFRKKYQSAETGKDISPRARTASLAVMVVHEPGGRAVTVLRDL